jgi:hypothetical protein
LTPQRSACETQIDYPDHRLLLQIPLTNSSGPVKGTDNGDDITILCRDSVSQQRQLERFWQEYQADLAECLK